MKTTRQRLAPIGLIIAGLGAVAVIGLYIVQREFNLAIQISLGCILGGLALFALLDPERVRLLIGGRQARYGTNLLVMGLAFLGIIVVINYLVSQNSKRWDLTENQQYTLSKETLATIEQLPEPVKVIGFFTPNYSSDSARTLLDQYKFASKGKISYEFINPQEDPISAENYKVNRDGTLVLVMGKNFEQVTYADETEITGGLLRLLSPGERSVYFLTGHGEFDPDGGEQNSYNMAKTILEGKNYTIKKLNLISDGKVPADASVVIVAGPQKPLSQAEVDALASYLKSGGSLIVMEEPTPLTSFGDVADPLSTYLADTWGIKLGNDMVVDLSSNEPFLAVSNMYGSSPISDKLQGVYTIYPTARSTTFDSSVTNAQLIELVLTSDNSWAETDLTALFSQDQGTQTPQIQADEGVDILGPVTIAVTAEDSTSKARVVVFGDADFASDQYFQAYGNGDMFVNSVDWTVVQEALINLTPKEQITRTILPPGRYTMNLILLGAVIILPLLFLAAGIVVWVQRRRRG